MVRTKVERQVKYPIQRKVAEKRREEEKQLVKLRKRGRPKKNPEEFYEFVEDNPIVESEVFQAAENKLDDKKIEELVKEQSKKQLSEYEQQKQQEKQQKLKQKEEEKLKKQQEREEKQKLAREEQERHMRELIRKELAEEQQKQEKERQEKLNRMQDEKRDALLQTMSHMKKHRYNTVLFQSANLQIQPRVNNQKKESQLMI